MDKAELLRKFKQENIPESFYGLNGMVSYDGFVLDQKSDSWEVYYTERGSKDELMIFDTEEEACNYLYKRIKRMMEYL